MSEIVAIETTNTTPVASKDRCIGLWKPALAAGAVALVLTVASISGWFGPGESKNGTLPVFSLFTRAMAAEEALFTGDSAVHIVNEIIVHPVSNPILAQMRWFPVRSLEASGEGRFHQLTLPAKPNEGFTVQDQAWYDPGTQRFARLFTVDGKAVFANSYDGTTVCALETNPDGALRIDETPVGPKFQPPKNPAEFLGIGAGLPNVFDDKNDEWLVDLGEGTLDDGTKVRLVRGGAPAEAADSMEDSHLLFKIRKSDNTIAEMEWLVGGEPLMVTRRVRTQTVDGSAVAWNLADIETMADPTWPGPKVGIRADMVVPDVSVARMVERADFETYVFAKTPAWAGARKIADILDIVSPPHRMFALTHRAKDGRHVVLMQSHTYNKMLGPLVRTGKVVYTSPKGFKVWSGPRDKWLADILLRSARAEIKDKPSKNRTGYMLESPAGTFPALAINGQLTEDELHALIDSLVPAKEYKDK